MEEIIKMKNLKNLYYIVFILTVSTLLISSCSELETNLSTPPFLTIHKEGVLNPASDDFHGKLVGTNGKGFDLCRQCHAGDFSGGTAEVNCKNCHIAIQVHTEGIVTPGASDFHGKFIANSSWNLLQCQQCHGVSYAGGVSSPSCKTCHTQPEGPEACNTCHGNFNNSSELFPPRDLDGNLTTNFPGVGAHLTHLTTNSLSASASCTNCHTVPAQFNSSGHTDGDSNADIIFNTLASSQNGMDAVYDFSTNTCANVYCHGAFELSKDSSDYSFIFTEDKMIGNNVSVKWNQVDGTQAVCGSCHGLPPIGHLNAALNECKNCHFGIVDDAGNIIDSTKHINGISNVYGN